MVSQAPADADVALGESADEALESVVDKVGVVLADAVPVLATDAARDADLESALGAVSALVRDADLDEALAQVADLVLVSVMGAALAVDLESVQVLAMAVVQVSVPEMVLDAVMDAARVAARDAVPDVGLVKDLVAVPVPGSAAVDQQVVRSALAVPIRMRLSVREPTRSISSVSWFPPYKLLFVQTFVIQKTTDSNLYAPESRAKVTPVKPSSNFHIRIKNQTNED